MAFLLNPLQVHPPQEIRTSILKNKKALIFWFGGGEVFQPLKRGSERKHHPTNRERGAADHCRKPGPSNRAFQSRHFVGCSST